MTWLENYILTKYGVDALLKKKKQKQQRLPLPPVENWNTTGPEFQFD
jgi:hypothetical protein